MTDTQSTLQGVRPHEKYYIDGADLHIIVEDRAFRVHRYFFEVSAEFRTLLASPSPTPGQPRKGSSQLTAITLRGVTAKQFATFCWVFYNPTYSLYDATLADWSDILHLAKEWQFAEAEKLAVRELEKMPIPIVERIALYEKHELSEGVLVPHYAALCTRGSPLDLAESEQLGMSTVVLINQTLHVLHSSLAGRKDKYASPSSSSPSAVNAANAAVISKIIAHIGADAGSGLPGGFLRYLFFRGSTFLRKHDRRNQCRLDWQRDQWRPEPRGRRYRGEVRSIQWANLSK
ncbi:hypothetical protein C8R46DRAFT_905481 [Mycena filopes]|nr:hypothetical protein C8R46DRAFT_905481 [Mycena filopes]